MKPLGFISNQKTSALIKDSSIVWFPVPKFDSPTVFTRLLDEEGGEFAIIPNYKVREVKQYYEHPLVLTTELVTEKGRIKITDLIPLGETVIIRKVEAEVGFKVLFKPRFRYALYRPIIKGNRFLNPRGRDCIAFLDFYQGESKKVSKYTWRFSSGSGILVANYATDTRHGVMSERGKVLATDYMRSFEETIKYWESYDVKDVEKFKELYKTSVFTLLGSIYSSSGGSIAAPTTSLPEVEGGNRNWDYRFAWVRDSSITAIGLLDAGLIVEGRRIIDFLFSLINFSSKPFYYPLYTIEGTIPPPEIKLNWLSGYKGSKPVRIGNAASKQVQLDVEGFFISAVYKYYQLTGDKVFIADQFDKLSYIADWISSNWSLKDSGIWEDRGEPKHYAHSKMMMWIALDKIGKMAKELGKVDRWSESREKLREWILTNCVKNNHFIQHCGGEDEVDAALLSAPIYGFIDVKDPLFLSTLEKIEKELLVDGTFVKRYKKDFLGEAKYPFLLTTVWLARVYVMLGEMEKAEKIVERIERVAGNLHLVGEHVDPARNEFTGNFPQVFVHAELVSLIEELNKKSLKLV